MRKLLQQARQLPDERKSALAAVIAGSLTAAIALVWSFSFVDVVTQAEPALAVQTHVGPVSGMVDQIKALFATAQTELETVQTEMGVPTASSTEMAPFDQAN